MIRKMFLLVILYTVSGVIFAEKLPIQIGTYEEQKDEFSYLFAKSETPCPSLDALEEQSNVLKMNTPIVDFIILCNALTLGGIEAEYEFLYFPLAARMIKLVDKGMLQMTTFPIWSSYGNKESMLVSRNVVEKGTIVKGIYALPTRTDILEEDSLEGLSQFLGVTNRLWSADAEAIKCMGLMTDNALSYQQMFAMVKEGMADYLLYSFVNLTDESLHIEHYDTTLAPVKNVKILMNDSLNFFISKKFNSSIKIHAALDKGLNILNQRKEIERLYKNLGYKNSRVSHWKTYGCNS